LRYELAAMTTMLRQLPKAAIAPRLAPRILAFAQPASQPGAGEIVAFRQVRSEAHVFAVRHALNAQEVAQIRAAVLHAAAEGRTVKLRVDRGEKPAGGGGHGNGFDINIQTLVEGE
jgi:hypothetical protein